MPKKPTPKKKPLKTVEERGKAGFNQDLADKICELLSIGWTLKKICNTPGMPNRATIWRWTQADPFFKLQYEEARDFQCDYLADEIISISDDASLDIKGEDKYGNTIYDKDHILRSRLMVDSRKWFCAKVRPRRYGEKPEVTMVIKPEDTKNNYADLTPTQRMDKLDELLNGLS